MAVVHTVHGDAPVRQLSRRAFSAHELSESRALPPPAAPLARGRRAFWPRVTPTHRVLGVRLLVAIGRSRSRASGAARVGRLGERARAGAPAESLRAVAPAPSHRPLARELSPRREQ